MAHVHDNDEQKLKIATDMVNTIMWRTWPMYMINDEQLEAKDSYDVVNTIIGELGPCT